MGKYVDWNSPSGKWYVVEDILMKGIDELFISYYPDLISHTGSQWDVVVKPTFQLSPKIVIEHRGKEGDIRRIVISLPIEPRKKNK